MQAQLEEVQRVAANSRSGGIPVAVPRSAAKQLILLPEAGRTAATLRTSFALRASKTAT